MFDPSASLPELKKVQILSFAIKLYVLTFVPMNRPVREVKLFNAEVYCVYESRPIKLFVLCDNC